MLMFVSNLQYFLNDRVDAVLRIKNIYEVAEFYYADAPAVSKIHMAI